MASLSPFTDFNLPSSSSVDLQPYIMSNTTGSTVSFKFKTTLGRMQLSYLRSATFGLGIIDCWVDVRHFL
jgi:hypothetical protein